MKERIIALEVNLRNLIQRIERLRNIPLSYEKIVKLQKAKLKIDELNDLITELEADQEF